MSEKTKQDGRNARSWWYDEARQMKRDGVSMPKIAAKFQRSVVSVGNATKGIPGKRGNTARLARGDVVGFKMGKLRRVVSNFTDAQVEEINKFRLESGISFSLAVSRLVDIAIQERRKANDA